MKTSCRYKNIFIWIKVKSHSVPSQLYFGNIYAAFTVSGYTFTTFGSASQGSLKDLNAVSDGLGSSLYKQLAKYTQWHNPLLDIRARSCLDSFIWLYV